jgi:type II secretory pathway pseudopilin PulG
MTMRQHQGKLDTPIRPPAGSKATEAAFTLVELLVTMMIFLVVLMTVVATFVTFNDSLAAARTFVTRGERVYNTAFELSAQLRSAAVPPGAVGTNVLIPQATVSAMSSTVAFCKVDPSNPSNFLYMQWTVAPLNSGLGLYQYTASGVAPCAPGGSALPSPPPLGQVRLSSLASGFFCYVSKNGTNMTGQTGCPGNPAGATYSTSAQIATCAVAVFIILTTKPAAGVAPITLKLGTGLRNQNSQLVTAQAVLPNGTPTPC